MTWFESDEGILYDIFMTKERRLPTTLFPPLDFLMYNRLLSFMRKNPEKSYLTMEDFYFDNRFILDYAQSPNIISKEHMEVLCYMLGQLHQETLCFRRARFISPELTSLITAKPRAFKAAIDKSKIRWPNKIKYIVKERTGKWIKDVDNIYVPMVCSRGHWVELVITLKTSAITVLDPHLNVFGRCEDDEKIKNIATAMPFILKRYSETNHISLHDLTPFTVSWSGFSCQLTNNGHCGLLAAKLMELHLHRSNLTPMSYETVISVRKQFVLDVYDHYVVSQCVPWYAHHPTP